ncbi:MAG: phosphoglycerate kinase [Armatimonadota bacterium]
MNKKTIEDVDVRDKRVLVRVDFNVPQDESGAITDDTRIRAALPTLRYLLDQGARVILMSHLGRPKGVDPKWTLAPVAERLSQHLGRPVQTASDCIGPEAEAAAQKLQSGDVLLLENVRFHPEEEKNDPEFARKLASLGEIYVNDAFGAAHRAHASTEGVTHYLPAVAGYLLGKELEKLGGAINDPQRPFVAILGGAKVKDKIGVIKNLLPKVDVLLLGGGMAYTFLKAQGLEIGKSLLDAGHLDAAKQTLQDVKEQGYRLEVPSDVVVADDFKNPTSHRTVRADEIPDDMEGVDIGPETIARYREILRDARTVVWNGPMGVFENPLFAEGTRSIAETLGQISQGEANVIIGGGDSAAAVEQLGYADQMDHISTGGGASLELLEGKTLPGVAALQDKA